MEISEDAYLKHYGVKGMRLGKRNPRDEAARKKQITQET